jgi:hypothetical protein
VIANILDHTQDKGKPVDLKHLLFVNQLNDLFPHVDIQNTLIVFAVACLGRLNAIGKQAGIQLGCFDHRSSFVTGADIVARDKKYRSET